MTAISLCYYRVESSSVHVLQTQIDPITFSCHPVYGLMEWDRRGTYHKGI